MSFTRLALIGPPASGKGTQCSRLALELDLLHLSTGHLIREEVEKASPLGLRAKDLINRGELLDDESVLALVKDCLSAQAYDRFLLDGFPRTFNQAQEFENIAMAQGKPLDAVLLLDVPEKILLERALNRATCPECGHTMGTAGLGSNPLCPKCDAVMERREDDSRETFARRMEAYRSQATPLLEFYASRDSLIRIEAGASSVEEVTQRLLSVISENGIN